MKLKEIIGPAALVLAAIGMGGWYFTSSYQPGLSVSGTSYTRNLKVTGLSALTPSADTTDPDPYYKLFIFPGDGTFQLTNAPTGSDYEYQHNYKEPYTGYQAFAESTDVYDDGDLPPKAAYQNINVSTGSGSNPSTYTPVNLGNKLVAITPVRKVVPQDSITYIVTYGNPGSCAMPNGTAEFTYDSTVLEYQGVQGYQPSVPYANYSHQNGKAQWTFPGLAAGEQHNVFLVFKTRNVQAGRVISPPPSASISLNNPPNLKNCNLDGSGFVLSAQALVESSHDPNHKTISPAEFCITDDTTFRVLITFQNDGANPVKKVTITDKLDTMFYHAFRSNGCQATLLDYGPKRVLVPPPTPVFNPADGTLTAVFNNINLPGTHQHGYGTDFLDPETQGFLLFSIPMSCLSDRHGCSAVCNRASIIFDCNPPLETNLALSRIRCDASVAQPAMPYSSPCDSCMESELTIPTPFTDTINSTLLGSAQTYFSPSDYAYFKWYPSTGLDDAYSPNPQVLELANRTYTLVASGPCKRLILHRRMVRPCSLALQVNYQIVGHSGCAPLYNLTLNASNNGLHTDALVWQDCSLGGEWSKDSVGAGTYYFSVKDPATGCYAEQWVTLPDVPFLVTDDPGDCTFNPTIEGGSGNYGYQWEYQSQWWLGTATSTAPPPFDLSGKSHVRVTITDLNNPACTVVLNIPGCRGRWENPVVLGLFVLVAFFFMGRWYWLRIRRKL